MFCTQPLFIFSVHQPVFLSISKELYLASDWLMCYFTVTCAVYFVTVYIILYFVTMCHDGKYGVHGCNCVPLCHVMCMHGFTVLCIILLQCVMMSSVVYVNSGLLLDSGTSACGV